MPDIKSYIVQPILQAQNAVATMNIAYRKRKGGELITLPLEDGSMSLVPTSDGRYLLTIAAVVDIPEPRNWLGGKSA